MTYDVIATGSKGNAVVINEEILIDCGIPYKKLEPYAKGLKLVLLTHRHSDHFKTATIRRLHQERPTLRFGCCEWMVGPLVEAGVDKHVIDLYKPGNTYIYGYPPHLQLCPESLVHDVENCCYHMVFGTEQDGEKVFYATDTGTLDGIEANDYDYYFVEANHTQADIEARAAEKLAKGKFAYEYRAAANHLSYEQAMDWLYQNMGPKSRYILLHGHTDRKEEADAGN